MHQVEVEAAAEAVAVAVEAEVARRRRQPMASMNVLTIVYISTFRESECDVTSA